MIFSNEGETSFEYPQPTVGQSETDASAASKPYRYLLYEEAERVHFPDENSIPVNTLVWVLLSKGKNKVPKLHKRARIRATEPDLDGRLLVEYPNQSTYNVRRKNLMPVFENLTHTILVASETNDYRRMSIVHTRKEDHFIEIGCDFGILVDSVDAKSSLGIDKSEESIQIANSRYPNQRFLLCDVFEDDLTEEINRIQKDSLVVSIDINGNRELPAVLKCIQFVLDSWAPRLIMVKSRELHAKMKSKAIPAESKFDAKILS